MEHVIKIYNERYPNILLRVLKGHFVTPHSHVNYYIDMSAMKARQSEANAVAEAIAEQYSSTTIVDTILCLDGCEVIGAYLADHLAKAGVLSMNAHKTIYITVPEFTTNGQMIFRENIRSMIKDKHVLLLLASATTGKTLADAIDTIRYYGGQISGVSAIFSAANSVSGMPIFHLFDTSDIPDYITYDSSNCKLCQNGEKIDAICNSFGYSTIN
ncbi:orotate phosphoribosyltransferase [Lachnospiraceae bacterium KH1T2]|nr:orotate phosphoribosyltransferase [Lachnospiraceae bacterium KH1T2]